MRLIPSTVLALGLALVLAESAHAQRQPGQRQPGQRQPFQFQPGAGFGGGGGLAALLQNESVQKELKLDKDQVEKVKEAVKKVQETNREALAKLRGLGAEERRTKMQELTATASADTLKAVDGILKPDQVKRLKQIDMQQGGAQAFSRPEVQKALKLKDEQTAKIKTINEDASKEMRTLFQGGNFQEAREKMAAMRKQTNEKIQGVLTDEQKKAWKELTGDPFEVSRTRGGPSTGPGGRPGTRPGGRVPPAPGGFQPTRQR